MAVMSAIVRGGTTGVLDSAAATSFDASVAGAACSAAVPCGAATAASLATQALNGTATPALQPGMYLSGLRSPAAIILARTQARTGGANCARHCAIAWSTLMAALAAVAPAITADPAASAGGIARPARR